MDRQQLLDAIRLSWCAETSADPDRWLPSNPAYGQCEVSSLVVLEYLGGDLDLHEVFRGGEHLEFHYSNRLSDTDVADLTIEQFLPGDEIRFLRCNEHAFVRANYANLKPELAARHQRLRSAVASRLGYEGRWLS